MLKPIELEKTLLKFFRKAGLRIRFDVPNYSVKVNKGLTTEIIDFDFTMANPGLGDFAKDLQKELDDLYFKEYEHDDVFVRVINRFNTGMIVIVQY